MTDLIYFSPDVTVLGGGGLFCQLNQSWGMKWIGEGGIGREGGGAFLPNFQTKLKFDKMSIYSLKLTKLCINKHFAGVKALHIVLNPINLVCCGS